MKTYLVGGAVRDALLELPVKERDWVVVGATPEEMLALGFTRADAEFPVFLHPETGEEYALARTEEKVGPGYKGFRVEAGPQVSLEQDLARRDLTINAMARDEDGNLIDPFDGREDLDQGLLRHVTPAFVEDPVRLLRIARFAAKLGRWGFRVAHGTQKLLRRMATSKDFASLRPERVWQEMRKALAEDQPWRFFEVIQSSGAWARLLPAMADALGEATAHATKELAPPLAALQHAVAAGAGERVRFAVVMYSVEAAMNGERRVCDSLPAEKAFCELLALLRRLGPIVISHEPDAHALLDVLDQTKALHRPGRFAHFLSACLALHPDCQRNVRLLRMCRDSINRLSTTHLQEQGFAGETLGKALKEQRLAVIEGILAGQRDIAASSSHGKIDSESNG